MFIGLVYLLLSLVALAPWRLETSCASGACSAVAQIGYFLGRPWWLWGALFYAAAGALCLGLPKNRLTGAFLAAGALFHAGLITYGYALTGGVCSTCWKFAAMGALLAAFYCLLPERKPSWAPIVSAGPARALAVIAVALLLINPQAPAVQLRSQVAETQAMPKSAQIAPESVKPESGPKTAEAAECFLPVSTPDGMRACLDLRQRPALFFAAWCPHCPEALMDAAKISPERRPYIVVTYLRDGEVEKAKKKLAENGLVGEPYYLAEKPPEGVQGVPALVWLEGSELKHVEGAGAIAEKLRIPKLLGHAEIPNPPDGGGKNAALAASLLNGKVVQPGEEFSFNRVVGPRTVSRGFVEGASVVETVYGPEMAPDVGGGVCRTATALYQAALNAGLKVVERHGHSLPVNYAEPGMDVAVAWPYWDFQFKNTAERPIKISAVSGNGKLRVELWLR